MSAEYYFTFYNTVSKEQYEILWSLHKMLMMYTHKHRQVLSVSSCLMYTDISNLRVRFLLWLL
jgi:hypothetical protein